MRAFKEEASTTDFLFLITAQIKDRKLHTENSWRQGWCFITQQSNAAAALIPHFFFSSNCSCS